MTEHLLWEERRRKSFVVKEAQVSQSVRSRMMNGGDKCFINIGVCCSLASPRKASAHWRRALLNWRKKIISGQRDEERAASPLQLIRQYVSSVVKRRRELHCSLSRPAVKGIALSLLRSTNGHQLRQKQHQQRNLLSEIDQSKRVARRFFLSKIEVESEQDKQRNTADRKDFLRRKWSVPAFRWFSCPNWRQISMKLAIEQQQIRQATLFSQIQIWEKSTNHGQRSDLEGKVKSFSSFCLCRSCGEVKVKGAARELSMEVCPQALQRVLHRIFICHCLCGDDLLVRCSRVNWRRSLPLQRIN